MNFREDNNTMETNFKDTVLYSVFEIRLHSVVVFPEIHLCLKFVSIVLLFSVKLILFHKI